MVIVVPQGTDKDATRDSAFYDGTYRFLQSIGLEELQNA